MEYRRDVICICGDMVLYNDLVIIELCESFDCSAANFYRWVKKDF